MTIDQEFDSLMRLAHNLSVSMNYYLYFNDLIK